MTPTSLQHQRGVGSHQHGDGTSTSRGPCVPRGIDSDVPTHDHGVATWGRTVGLVGTSAGGSLHPRALVYSHPHTAECHSQGGQETGVMKSLEGQQLPSRLSEHLWVSGHLLPLSPIPQHPPHVQPLHRIPMAWSLPAPTVPGTGLHPGGRVEERGRAPVAGVGGVDALHVSVARVMEELHEDGLDGLGLVDDSLGAHLQAADGIPGEAPALHQPLHHRQAQGVDVLVGGTEAHLLLAQAPRVLASLHTVVPLQLLLLHILGGEVHLQRQDAHVLGPGACPSSAGEAAGQRERQWSCSSPEPRGQVVASGRCHQRAPQGMSTPNPCWFPVPSDAAGRRESIPFPSEVQEHCQLPDTPHGYASTPPNPRGCSPCPLHGHGVLDPPACLLRPRRCPPCPPAARGAADQAQHFPPPGCCTNGGIAGRTDGQRDGPCVVLL